MPKRPIKVWKKYGFTALLTAFAIGKAGSDKVIGMLNREMNNPEGKSANIDGFQGEERINIQVVFDEDAQKKLFYMMKPEYQKFGMTAIVELIRKGELKLDIIKENKE